MKAETPDSGKGLFPVTGLVLLILALLACEPPTPVLGPTPTAYVPTGAPPTEALTSVPTESPSEAPSPGPPPISSLVPLVCPAPGSPALAQPINFADYAAAIQQYLSAGGSVAVLESTLLSWNALPDGTGQVVASDLTGNGTAEVIVVLREVNPTTVFPAGDLLVFGCQAGIYALLHQEGYDPGGMAVRLLGVVDLNVDGRPDVAYTTSTCGAHTCFETLKAVGWVGAGFANLMGGPLDMPYPTYVVAPGRIEAQSGGIGSVGAEPQRGYTEIWEWNGSVLTVTQQIWAPPVYRYHALLDGDRAMHSGDHATAIAAYERVIVDGTLQEWGAVSGGMDPAVERAQLAAFARWRLVLTRLLAGDPAGAQLEYNRLQADHPAGTAGHDVATLAQVFWGGYSASSDITDGCVAAVAAAETDTSVQDFFNMNYGYANPWWEPVDFCPFTE